MDVVSVVRVVLFNIYKIYKRFFLFTVDGGGGDRFEVLKLKYFNFCVIGIFKTFKTSEMELFAESC